MVGNACDCKRERERELQFNQRAQREQNNRNC